MRQGRGFAAHPIPWATVIMLLVAHAGLVVFALRTGRVITLDDAMMFWPTHLILAANLFAIFAPAGKRASRDPAPRSGGRSPFR